MEYTNMLLDDLINKYINDNDLKSFEEINRRLKFCGFNNQTIEYIIGYEGNILNIGKKRNDLICNEYFIIPKKNHLKLFENINKCIYRLDDNIYTETLLLTEILAIIDEAIVITYGLEINKYKCADEIKMLSNENSSNWLFKEFYNRLENICRYASNVPSTNKEMQFVDKIDILYENEMQIIMNNRWPNLAVRNNLFEPYSDEYFANN